MTWAARGMIILASISCAAGCSGAVDNTPQVGGNVPEGGGGMNSAASPMAQAGAGGRSAAGEMPSAGDPPSAGAGGGAPVGPCPAVLRYTTATIRADFALSEADAQHSFSVCRNSECYDGHLGESGSWSHYDQIGAMISLAVLSEGGSKSVILSWGHLPEPGDYTAVDRFQLSFATVPEAPPTFLVDAQVTYQKTVDTMATAGIPHPELCGSWGEANVDLRKAP